MQNVPSSSSETTMDISSSYTPIIERPQHVPIGSCLNLPSIDINSPSPRSSPLIPAFYTAQISEQKFVGNGTFGEVYLVKVPRLGKVAYKKNRDQSDISDQEIVKEMRELTCSIMLNHHPNIVAFYGEVVDAFYNSTGFLMEYMVDGSLYSYIENCKSKSPSSISLKLRNTWAYHIALGLAYMHARNIMHRDLNPKNILLGPVSIAKIADFGTSKEITRSLSHTRGHGTGFYKAPEIILNSKYSIPVDVYSYAMTLYFIFSSKTPFENDRSMHKISEFTMHARLCGVNGPIVRPDLGYGVIDELIRHCWELDPKQRPTMDEVAYELEMIEDNGEMKYPKIELENRHDVIY